MDANSIVGIYYVVWRPGRKGTRTFGSAPASIVENDDDATLPPAFGPRQARTLTITHEVALTGSHDAALVSATEPLKGSPQYALPKY